MNPLAGARRHHYTGMIPRRPNFTYAHSPMKARHRLSTRFTCLALAFFGSAIPAAVEAAAQPDVRIERSLYFPPARGEWERVQSATIGWNADKLNAALHLAGTTHASGVVILHRGRILAEQYWKLDADARAGAKARNYGALVRGRDAAGHVIEDVASVQKSISAMLVGIAQHRGLLRLEDPVQKHLGVGWSKASSEQEQAITLRHLLTMTSGLKDDLTFEAAAGTRWRYNSSAYAHTVKVVAAASKKTPNDLTREWLTGRIGMADSNWVERPAQGRETVVNALGFATTARDLARFGLLILADGQYRGETVIADRDYLHAALRPSQTLNPSYGYLWWLNGQSEVARGAGERVKGPLIPTAPPDLVAALGAVDRKLYVVPSLELVVARLGSSTGPSFQNEFWRLLMEAAPKK
jgi:CubicO group peptidase (beta-lactamase class C family)